MKKQKPTKSTKPTVSASKTQIPKTKQPTNSIDSAFNHKLHINVLDNHTQKQELIQAMASKKMKVSLGAEAISDNQIHIPLTTISESGNFDAYINIVFSGQKKQDQTPLLVDSGNTMLVVPRFEDIDGLEDYIVLGEGNEPWGSPAKIVKGPIQIPTTNGSIYTLNDCIFYACTGGARTANFGTGCITPWTANPSNKTIHNIVMQAPLSYSHEFTIAEFNYEPAENILNNTGELTVASGSLLTLHRELPVGYSMFNIRKQYGWMSLVPVNIWINGVQTGWPGNYDSAAFIDTGGGPMFLSDPKGFIYPFTLPESVACPTWSGTSQNCNCSDAAIGLQLMDPYNYAIWNYMVDTKKMPASVQGLTLVACEENAFMMGQPGMNIGGISALFMYILIDYSAQRVGFKMK